MTVAPSPFSVDLDPAFLECVRRQLSSLRLFASNVGLDFDDLVGTTLLRLVGFRPAEPDLSENEVREVFLARATTIAKNFLLDCRRKKRPLTNVDFSSGAGRVVGRTPPADHAPPESVEDLWRAVKRATEAMPVPPPREFVEAWYVLRREGELVTVDQVGLWARRFGKAAVTIYRWIGVIQLEVTRSVVHGERGEQL